MRPPRALVRRLLGHAAAAAVLAAVAGRAVEEPPPSASRDLAWTDDARRDALRRARVWQEPAIPIERADLAHDRDALPDDLACHFELDEPHGTAPKFDCTLDTGAHVKIKYGGAEPHGEVAATRLLRALGFGADRVEFVKRVRCRGCPWFPFATMKMVALARAKGLYQRVINYDSAVEFDWVAVERKFDGEPIETPTVRGWAWHEVAAMKAAPRAHVDAFRLLAVFLAHWDNKAENQRLVCLPGSRDVRGRCRRPFALIQDAGATFGPRKVDLDGWRRASIWRTRADCLVTMEALPHGGATFGAARISEAGRRFLATRMAKLSDAQIAALFRGARFDHHGAPIANWVDAFKTRRHAIADGPPCPIR